MTYACQGAPVLVRSPMHTGLDAGRSFPSGNDAYRPPSHRIRLAVSCEYGPWIRPHPDSAAGAGDVHDQRVGSPLSARTRSDWSMHLRRPTR